MAAHLRNAEGNGTQSAGDGFWFEIIGVALASLEALIGVGPGEPWHALLAYGFVDEQADAFGKRRGLLR